MKMFTKIFIATFALTAVSCSFNPAENNTAEVSGVSLDYETKILAIGETFQLHASIEPYNAANKNVTWKVTTGSNYVSCENGLLTGLKVGTAKVRVSSVANTRFYKICSVSVVNQVIEETGVTLSQSSATLKQGKTLTLSATVSPSNASDKSVTWSSSNPSVASVDNKGVVTALQSSGTAVITAKTARKYFTASCTITTDEPVHPASITLSKNIAEINEGRNLTLDAEVLPADTYNKNVTWTSSNPSVASVDSKGLVTALKAGGSTTITAKTVDGGLQDSCVVTVMERSPNDDWTVLIYMCGSDLEAQGGYAVSDIKEILKVANQPDDVNIIIETGGATKWTSNSQGQYSAGYSISNSVNQIHRVEKQKIVLDYQFSNKPKMGSSDTLQTFIEYGLEKYPADKTALILWNHGGGMQGVCFANTSAGNYEDGLFGYEVCDAVSGALQNKGMAGQKLEWIGYDACLMQVQDIAEMNSQYFNYMVASEESEAGAGWDYDTWIDDLYAKKDTTVILKAIVDGFIDDNGGKDSTKNDQTLSYLNLAHAAEYREAWEAMATSLRSKITSGNKDDFNDLIDTCKHYAEESYEGYGLFDAKDFVNKLAKDSTFKTGNTEAVLAAHSKFVEYSLAGKGAGESYGVCLYWCFNSRYKDDNPYEAGKDTNFTNWAYLSNTYCGSGSSSGGGGGWDWGDDDDDWWNWGW